MLKETNIAKFKLKETLEQNLEDHIQIYNLALESWQKEYKEYVEDFNNKVQSNDFKVNFKPPFKPSSYAKNYEDVIAQLDMSADEVITLDNIEFQNYILDEWNFTKSFYTTISGSTNINYDNLSISSQNKMKQYILD